LKSVYEVFRERGFVEQITDESLIKELLDHEQVTCYIGFDRQRQVCISVL